MYIKCALTSDTQGFWALVLLTRGLSATPLLYHGRDTAINGTGHLVNVCPDSAHLTNREKSQTRHTRVAPFGVSPIDGKRGNEAPCARHPQKNNSGRDAHAQCTALNTNWPPHRPKVSLRSYEYRNAARSFRRQEGSNHDHNKHEAASNNQRQQGCPATAQSHMDTP